MKSEITDEQLAKATALMKSMKFNPIRDGRNGPIISYATYATIVISPREIIMQDFDREKIIELFMSRARASFDL